jgi:predicted DNA-binding protein (UPF0251 family)
MSIQELSVGTRRQPTKSHPSKAIRVAAETRRYEVLELVKAGQTEREIAARMGVARSLIHNDIKRVLGDLARASMRTADNVRSVQMERYTGLLARWWPLALEGDEAATMTTLKIMARIDVINGIVPDRPLISMTQNVQVGESLGLMELARAIANGSGQYGTGPTGSVNGSQPDALPEGGAGGQPIQQTD